MIIRAKNVEIFASLSELITRMRFHIIISVRRNEITMRLLTRLTYLTFFSLLIKKHKHIPVYKHTLSYCIHYHD